MCAGAALVASEDLRLPGFQAVGPALKLRLDHAPGEEGVDLTLPFDHARLPFFPSGGG